MNSFARYSPHATLRCGQDMWLVQWTCRCFDLEDTHILTGDTIFRLLPGLTAIWLKSKDSDDPSMICAASRSSKDYRNTCIAFTPSPIRRSVTPESLSFHPTDKHSLFLDVHTLSFHTHTFTKSQAPPYQNHISTFLRCGYI